MYQITWITTHLPTPEGWMAKLAMLANLRVDISTHNTNNM